MSNTDVPLTCHVDGTRAVLRKQCVRTRYVNELSKLGAPSTANDPDYIKAPESKEELLSLASQFIDDYFEEVQSLDNTKAKILRLKEINEEIEETGTWYPRSDEILFASKQAWRNNPRCIGRPTWRQLELFDRRYVTSCKQAFSCILEHIRFATNGGALLSCISVFPNSLRIWNSQYFGFAGYKLSDGSILGDPGKLSFTNALLAMGWQPPMTNFDILPIVLQWEDDEPEYFEIPEEYVIRVPFRHPKWKFFEELNLQWYGLPAVTSMGLEFGGLYFNCTPFNGWYQETEVGVRDLGDEYRYNQLPIVAKKMGLDTSDLKSFWKDHAALVLAEATLYSFTLKGVKLVDHHTAAETFVKWYHQDIQHRGRCPADWTWIIPPISASTVPTYHQEMITYNETPRFTYQKDPMYGWYRRWRQSNAKLKSLRQLAIFIYCASCISTKVMTRRFVINVVYASETGKCEAYAHKLARYFTHKGIKATVVPAHQHDVNSLVSSRMVCFVLSTFGVGEPPAHAREWYRQLQKLPKVKEDDQEGYLHGMSYAIFGAGSSIYHQSFARFSKDVNQILHSRGARLLGGFGVGDEMKNQAHEFSQWTARTWKAVSSQFKVEPTESENSGHVKTIETSQWDCSQVSAFTLRPTPSPLVALPTPAALPEKSWIKVVHNSNLLPPSDDRATFFMHLDSSLKYQAGDHLSVQPSNEAAHDINYLLKLIGFEENEFHQFFNIEVHEDANVDVEDQLGQVPSLPVPCELYTAFAWYMDISTPLSQHILKVLVGFAKSEKDKKELLELSTNESKYNEWVKNDYPSLISILEKFSSLQNKAVPLSVWLCLLPNNTSRFYSISSCPKTHPGAIHITYSVVSFSTPSGYPRKGVCSSWLSSLKPGQTVPCSIVSSSFKLANDMTQDALLNAQEEYDKWTSAHIQARRSPPLKPQENRPIDLPRLSLDGSETPALALATLDDLLPERKAPLHKIPPIAVGQPIILIGAGTGIAPLRSFWQALGHLSSPPPCYLIFGCRNEGEYLFRHEIEDYIKKGIITEAFVGFSRLSGMPKRYVQDVLYENRDLIAQLIIDSNACIYVCGSISVEDGIEQSLYKILLQHNRFPPSVAFQYVQRLRLVKRFQADVFGVTFDFQKEISCFQDMWTSPHLREIIERNIVDDWKNNPPPTIPFATKLN